MNSEPERIVLEITEATAMSDDAGTHESLRLVDSSGMSVAIDDFGTGYSSLASLSRLPAMSLKIDQSFVHALGTGEHAGAVVLAIVEMAHRLGLRVTAEGVETEEQRLTVARLGCDRGQGYYWSAPLPADAFESWWQEHRQGRALVSVHHTGRPAAGTRAAAN
jgi:EAL domain-containing protein (putative c-di-GMP-specific phosphodiesterase class I)